MSLSAQNPEDRPLHIALSIGCRSVLSRVRDADPDDELPERVVQAAVILDRCAVPLWFRHDLLVAAHRDLVGPVLDRLRTWREFEPWQGQGLTVRWTRRPMLRRDAFACEALPGHGRAIREADRLTWPGDDPAPWFGLDLSLPWFLLSDDDEIERGLHGILAGFGIGSRHGHPVPYIVKHDIQAHASTLARYGVRSSREAMSVFHAARHPEHEGRLRAHGFDPVTGQGELWSPRTSERQPSMFDEGRRRRPSPRWPLRDLEVDGRPSVKPGEA